MHRNNVADFKYVTVITVCKIKIQFRNVRKPVH